MFEPWPDEPDETSPESRWGNPEQELPRVPEVSTKESDVDPHTFKTFWVSVVFANAAVFGVSLGAMLWYFRGQALFGGALVVVGLFAGLRVYASYRTFKGDPPASTSGSEGEGESENEGEAEPAPESESDSNVEPESVTESEPDSHERNR